MRGFSGLGCSFHFPPPSRADGAATVAKAITARPRAQGAGVPEFKRLHAVADAAVPRVQFELSRVLSSLRSRMPSLDESGRMIDARAIDTLLEALLLTTARFPEFSALFQNVREELRRVVRDAARVSADTINDALLTRKSAGRLEKEAPVLEAALVFDETNPLVFQFLLAYEFDLIRGIEQKTAEAVRAIVVEGYEKGLTGPGIAKRVREIVGLTPKQAAWISNFRDQLESRSNNPDGRVLTPVDQRRLDAIARRRALGHVTGSRVLTPTEIDDLVEKYRKSMIQRRALNIARTETIRSSAEGQALLWDQAERDGLFAGVEPKRFWIFVRDDRTRESHKAIAKLNPDGVGLHQPFKTEKGELMRPPAGVNCRCAVVMRLIDDEP